MLDLKLWREIYNAARANDVSTLKTLLSQRPSPETLNHRQPYQYGNTPLHSASFRGHLEVAKLLIEAGANVDATGEDGETPLHMASSNGHLEVAKLLIEAGAKTSNMTENGSVTLHDALSKHWFELAELLIDAGASYKIDAKTSFSVHNLLSNPDTRASTTFISKMFTLLTAAGATVDGATVTISPRVPSDVIRAIVPENTPFWLAANNDTPMLAAELAGGLDPNMKTENGMTLLHWACAGDAPECVQLLLDAGAGKEAGTPQPIFYCMHESSQCLECMINYGADANDSVKSHYPIHFALAANSPACVTVLVGAGAWVTKEEMNYNCSTSPPVSALEMCPVPVDALRVLLAAAGERVLSETINGWTHLHLAAENFTVDVVRVLVEGGADVDATDRYGQTPLHLASYKGHIEIVKLLVDAGANFHATDTDGSTPQQLALDKGHHQVAELLSEASKTQRAALKDAEELRRQNAEHQAEIARLHAAAVERTALQRKIDELQAANFALTAQVARLQTETAQAKAEPAAARPSSTSNVAELQLRLDRTQNHLEMVKEERDDYIAKNAELRKQIQALESA